MYLNSVTPKQDDTLERNKSRKYYVYTVVVGIIQLA